MMQSITELDVKRSEHLELVWKEVNASFGNIFSTLLPGTTAKLETLEGKDLEAGLEVKVRLPVYTQLSNVIDSSESALTCLQVAHDVACTLRCGQQLHAL